MRQLPQDGLCFIVLKLLHELNGLPAPAGLVQVNLVKCTPQPVVVAMSCATAAVPPGLMTLPVQQSLLSARQTRQLSCSKPPLVWWCLDLLITGTSSST